MYLAKCFVVTVYFYLVSSEPDLPPNFPKCSRNDIDIDACLLKGTEAIRPLLRAGIPELDIPSLAPIRLQQVILKQNTEKMNYLANLTNVVITGFDSYDISKIIFDFKKLVFNFEIPEYTVESKFNLSGHILQVPMEGKGDFFVRLIGCHFETIIDLKEITKNDQKYLQIEDINKFINVTDMQDLKLDGLFGGSDILSKAAIQVILDNKQEFFKEFIPVLEDTIEEAIANIVYKHIFKVPLDKLFPLM